MRFDLLHKLLSGTIPDDRLRVYKFQFRNIKTNSSMIITAAKRKTRFDTFTYLIKTARSNADEKILELGEIADRMYYAARSTGIRSSIVLKIETEELQDIHVFLTYVEGCLFIDEIDYHESLLKPAFVNRLVWLILLEAKECQAQQIEGRTYAAARVKILIASFSRYGFTAYYKKPHHHFLFRLTNA